MFRMNRLFVFASCALLLTHSPSSIAAVSNGAESLGIRPLAVSGETKTLLDHYSLEAYEGGNAVYKIDGLLFTPRPLGLQPLPLLVYIPGSGEIGAIDKQFRQRAIFERVTSPEFQKRHPCYLLAISPPQQAHTLVGGMPGHPSALQQAIHSFILDIARGRQMPKVDVKRIYLTGFSYGGNGVYALAQHFPGYAAVVPIAALPPAIEYFSEEHPGNWWHFYNEGDYEKHGLDTRELENYCRMVQAAGGDFRIGSYPAIGHDAWTKAWREEVVWDWMFSKSRDGGIRQESGAMRDTPFISDVTSGMRCTTSVSGSDDAHGPERAADGLDTTWYTPSRPFMRDDWWQIELPERTQGRVCIYSGDMAGNRKMKSGYAECSTDGKRWTTCGVFSRKTGKCEFSVGLGTRFIRVRSRAVKPDSFLLRRISLTP